MLLWIIFLFASTLHCAEGFLVSDSSQNASLYEIYEELRAEFDNLTQEINDLQQQLYDLPRENGDLQAEINNLTLNYDIARRDLADATNQHIRLRHEYESVANQYNQVSKEFRNVAGMYDIMKQQYSWLNCDYNVLLDEYESQIHQPSTGQPGTGSHSKTNKLGIQLDNLNIMYDNPVNNLTCPPKELVRLAFAFSWPDRQSYFTQGLLPFTNEFYNDENAYDTNSGKFVCKTPGLYFFATSILRQVGKSPATSCYLKVNGQPVTYMEAYSDKPQWGDPMATGTIVVHLNLGDEVYIDDCSDPWQIAGYSNFMGFLIDADFITNIQ